MMRVPPPRRVARPEIGNIGWRPTARKQRTVLCMRSHLSDKSTFYTFETGYIKICGTSTIIFISFER